VSRCISVMAPAIVSAPGRPTTIMQTAGYWPGSGGLDPARLGSSGRRGWGLNSGPEAALLWSGAPDPGSLAISVTKPARGAEGVRTK
jgi:hypothetical protein